METNFERGRSFANELDFQLQLDDWFSGRANTRTRRVLRCRPVDRLPEDVAAMITAPPQRRGERAALGHPRPGQSLPIRHQRLLRGPPAGGAPRRRLRHTDHGRGDRVGHREVAALHLRSFAKHRTVTALEHARALKDLRGERTGNPQVQVQTLSLAVYDELIGA